MSNQEKSINVRPYGNFFIVEVLKFNEFEDEYCSRIIKKGTFNNEHLEEGIVVWYKNDDITKKIIKNNSEFHIVSKSKFFMFSDGGF